MRLAVLCVEGFLENMLVAGLSKDLLEREIPVVLIFVDSDRPSLILVGPSEPYLGFVFSLITSGKTPLEGQYSFLLIGDKGTHLNFGFSFGFGIGIVRCGSLHVTLFIGLHP